MCDRAGFRWGAAHAQLGSSSKYNNLATPFVPIHSYAGLSVFWSKTSEEREAAIGITKVVFSEDRRIDILCC